MRSWKYFGKSKAVIRTVIFCVMPKCRARQVTSSPSPINPAVTPAMATSPVRSVLLVCNSMLRDKSKHRSIGARIIVTSSKVTIPSRPVYVPPGAPCPWGWGHGLQREAPAFSELRALNSFPEPEAKAKGDGKRARLQPGVNAIESIGPLGPGSGIPFDPGRRDDNPRGV
jgi:hypothetical protein